MKMAQQKCGIGRLFPVVIMLMAGLPAERIQGEAVDADAEQQHEIQQLIDALGADEYRDREKASAALLALGASAQPFLRVAAQSPHLETRTRATRLLRLVEQRTFEARIAAFLTDQPAGQHVTLPGWERAKERLGDDQSGREVFAAMFRAEPTLAEAYEEGPAATAVELKTRIEVIYQQQLQQNGADLRSRNQLLRSMGENVKVLLFYGSDSEVSLPPDSVAQFTNVFRKSWQPTRVAHDTDRHRLGRWLAGWVLNRFNGAQREPEGIKFGMNYNVPETVQLAMRMIEQGLSRSSTHRGSIHPYNMPYAILCVGRFGDDWQLAAIEQLLSEELVVGTGYDASIRKHSDRPKIQLRDVALGVLVGRTSQSHAAYGLRHVNKHETQMYASTSIFFMTDEDRQAALRKWQEWRRKNVLFEGEPPRPLIELVPPKEGMPPEPTPLKPVEPFNVPPPGLQPPQPE